MRGDLRQSDPDDSAGFGSLRIGDVDEAHGTKRAVGIDQCHAVVAGGGDLGGCRRGLVDVGRRVVGHGEAGDAVEHHVGVGRQRNRGGEGGREGRE